MFGAECVCSDGMHVCMTGDYRPHCGACGGTWRRVRRPVPTMDERARSFHERGTTVAELCDRAGRRGPTLAGRIVLGGIRLLAAIGSALAKGSKRK